MMRKTKAAIAAGASVLIVGAGTGVAFASTSGDDAATSPSPSASPSDSHKGKAGKPGKQDGKKRKGMLQRVEHGTFTLSGKKHRVIAVQRGEVQDISSKSVTIRSKDGYKHTYSVTDDSKVRKSKEKSSIDKVADGDRVGVVAEHDKILRINDRGKS